MALVNLNLAQFIKGDAVSFSGGVITIGTVGGGGGMTNPMSAVGDMIYGGTAGAATALSGNITTTKKFLSQTGTGSESAAPVWAQVVIGDLGNISTNRLLGRITAGSGAIEELTPTQVTSMLDVFTASLKGLVPSGGSASTYLRGDGTWQVISNPMSELGDMIYGASGGAQTRLAGNTTTAKQYLSQTGTGTGSAIPSWSAIAGADVTGAALTKVDDTNVTLTLGGTPTTALLRAASITAGWTGTLAVSRGGLGVGTITGVLIGNGTSAVSAVTGTANQLLRRNAGDTAYEFFTPTYISAAITSLNGLTASSQTFANDTNVTISSVTSTHTIGWSGTLAVSRGGLGVGTVTGILVGNGTSAVTAVAGTASQLLRRNAGNTAYEFFTPTYLTANQTITLSGDVSGTGTTAITTTIGANKVTLGMMAQVNTDTYLGRTTALAGNVESIAMAALTKTDDTNVTLTLGGTPTTSLLKAVSLTLGWTGTLAVSRGGLGVGTVTGILVGNGTSAVTAVAGTASQLLRRNAGNTAYEFFTPTYISAAITSLNGLTAASQTFANDTNVTISSATSTHTIGWSGTLAVSRGGLGVGTVTGILVGNGTSAVSAVAGTANQLLRRNAGNTAYEFFTPTYMTNPMTTLGDIIYEDAVPAPARLAGNITTTKQFLSQTGTGVVSAAPAWSTIAGTDVTGAALTKVDDTNVTLTLGGTPTTALLRAASLTLGWTGTLAVSRGGLGVGTVTGILVGNGTSAVTAVAGTASQLLRRNAGNTAYEFFTPTYISAAITSLNGLTAASQTFANDTNVTISSVTSTHTIGWSGTLAVSRGGLGVGTITGVLIGNGTSAVTAVSGTALQVLRRNAGNTAYEFATISSGASSTGTNDLNKSDGAGGFALSYVTTSGTDGSILLGAGQAGSTRFIGAEGSAADISISLLSKGTGASILSAGGGITFTVNNSVGATFNNGTSNPVFGYSISSNGGYSYSNTAATNTIKEAFTIASLTTGVPAVGIGVSLGFQVETASSVFKEGHKIEVVSTSVTSTAETFRVSHKIMYNGVTAERYRFDPIGMGIYSATTASSIGLYTTDGTKYVTLVAGATNVVLATGTSQTLELQTNANQTRLSINSTGGVGIGVTPNATAGRLDVGNDVVAFSTSDKRLKEEVINITGALDRVMSMNGVRFRWKKELEYIHGFSGYDIGVLAQDVAMVAPEIVTTRESGYMAVKYEKLVPILIEAVKEQQREIQSLKARLR